MENLVVTIVKTALKLPLAVLGEARKLVGNALGRQPELSEDEVEQAQEEIQAGVREQAQASIETVKVAEAIREQTVTADDVKL